MKLSDLHSLGTSVWIDDLSRAKLTGQAPGSLPHRISQGARGVTTNPSIFSAAITGSADYAVDIAEMKGASVESVIEKLTTDDVRRACDLFSELYRASNRVDGRVSIEVDPRLAHDTEATIKQAHHLWQLIDRPNVMIKVPATLAGIPAITRLIADGISVNVTLIFSRQRYEAVIDAFIAGCEGNSGDLSQVQSVASFFVSRIDSAIDPLLKARNAQHLCGAVAVANARLAYKLYEEKVASSRWQECGARGGQMQRPLWASTGVKDPSYSSTLYVDTLVAPQTVNTMPQPTIDATIAGGANLGYPFDYHSAESVINSLADFGISFDEITAELERDGVAKFEQAWIDLLANVEKALG